MRDVWAYAPDQDGDDLGDVVLDSSASVVKIMSPTEARELADMLVKAADRADQVALEQRG